MMNEEQIKNENPKYDINGGQFDPQQYMKLFLKNQGVKDIISKNIELQNEIKNYDQEIQNLVFENYNKFIVSIDTVKNMKNDIQKVSQKIEKLDRLQQSISGYTEKINGTLRVKQQEIQKLDTVNKDLTKLRNLCDFPKVLKEDQIEFYKKYDRQRQVLTDYQVDMKSLFRKSREEYQKCFRKLREYQNEPMIQPIYQESLQILGELKESLWNLVNSQQVEFGEIKDVTQILIGLLDEKDSILQNYLKKVKNHVNQKYEKIVQKYFENQSVILCNEYHNQMDGQLQIQQQQQQQDDVQWQQYIMISKEVNEQIEKRIENNRNSQQQFLCNIVDLVNEECFGWIAEERQFLAKIVEDKEMEYYKDQLDLVEDKIRESIIEKVLGLIQKGACNMELLRIRKVVNDESIIENQMQKILEKKKKNVLEEVLKISWWLDNQQGIDHSVEMVRRNVQGQNGQLKWSIQNGCQQILLEMRGLGCELDRQEMIRNSLQEYMQLWIGVCSFWGQRESQESMVTKRLLKIDKSQKISYYQTVKNQEEINDFMQKMKVCQELFIVFNQVLQWVQLEMIDKQYGLLFDNNSNNKNLQKEYYEYRQNQVKNVKMNREQNIRNMIQFCNQQLFRHIEYNTISSVGTNNELQISYGMQNCLRIMRRIVLNISVLFDERRQNNKKGWFSKSQHDIDMATLICRKTSHYQSKEQEINGDQFLVSVLVQFMKHMLKFLSGREFGANVYQQIKLDFLLFVQMAVELVRNEDEQILIGFYYEMLRIGQIKCTDNVTMLSDLDSLLKVAQQFKDSHE